MIVDDDCDGPRLIAHDHGLAVEMGTENRDDDCPADSDQSKFTSARKPR
jgi:hypothetical protein